MSSTKHSLDEETSWSDTTFTCSNMLPSHQDSAEHLQQEVIINKNLCCCVLIMLTEEHLPSSG